MASSEEPITIADVTVEDESSSEPSAERKTSTGSGDIQLSSIQVIVRGRSCGDAGDEDSQEEEEEEEKPKKKKKVTKRKSNGKPEPTAAEVLTKTLAQALRLINEQKEKEKQKERKEAIRQMALAQKEKMESLGAPRVILHC